MDVLAILHRDEEAMTFDEKPRRYRADSVGLIDTDSRLVFAYNSRELINKKESKNRILLLRK